MPQAATTSSLSSSNVQGGLAGLATTVIMGFLTNAGYLAIAASAVGLPEATFAVVCSGIIGIGVKVAVSHVAELRNADAVLRELQSIKSESSPSDFPCAPSENVSKGQENSNINQ